MPEPLPQFKYHPDPIASEVIESSTVICLCCGKARGYIYTGPIYCTDDLDSLICPWCIADGSAASKFDASFADSYPLNKAKLPQSIIDEIHFRTPAYISWQEPEWLSHCNDACEFHGNASIADLEHVSQTTKGLWLSKYQQNEDGWNLATKGYKPKGHSAFYKFVCRHCGLVLLGWDLD